MSEDLKMFQKNWEKDASSVSLGVLILNSSALAICDPVGLSETERSDRSMFIDAECPKGEAIVSMKTWPSKDNNLKIAFLALMFSSDDVVNWVKADKVGGPNPFEGFDVDYGNVGFMSENMRSEYLTKAAEFEDSAYDEWLWLFIDGEGEIAPDVAEIPLPSGLVFKAVSAPGGNGSYDAFVGYSAEGAITAVVVDLITPALELM